MWFVFPLPAGTVRAWGSITGLERIYVDDELVSEHRSLGMSSTHDFSMDGRKWSVEFKTLSLLTVKVQCALLSDALPPQVLLTRYDGPKPVDLPTLVVAGLIGIIGGLSAVYYQPTLRTVIIASMLAFCGLTTFCLLRAIRKKWWITFVADAEYV